MAVLRVRSAMIYFVTRRLHAYTMGDCLNSRRIADTTDAIRLLSYETLFDLPALPVATYVFCDHERLSVPELEHLTLIWMRLERSGAPVRLFNDPRRVRRRYDLLQSLHAAGINDFRAYRVTEPQRPNRYPVFLRGENDHHGPRSALIHDAKALDDAIFNALSRKTSANAGEPLLIVEYCARPEQDGHYCKFGAFRVGDRIVARHRFVATDWNVKITEVLDDAAVAEELRYVEANPHEAALAAAFDVAGIDYGRADYAIVEGRLAVYEINTNPNTVGVLSDPVRLPTDDLFANRFAAALKVLDTPWSGEMIPIRGGEPSSDAEVAERLERDHAELIYRSRIGTRNALRRLQGDRPTDPGQPTESPDHHAREPAAAVRLGG